MAKSIQDIPLVLQEVFFSKKLTQLDKKKIENLKENFNKEIENSFYSGQKNSKYEEKVIKSLLEAKIKGNIKQEKTPNNKVNLYGNVFNLEVKLFPTNQLGFSQIEYKKESGSTRLIKSLEPNFDVYVAEVAKQKKESLDNLLKFIIQQEAKEMGEKIKGFPLVCAEEIWREAKRKNMQVQAEILLESDAISRYYIKKGINYLQIGDSGLFYLSANPANLPIPQFKGNGILEIRVISGNNIETLSDGTKIINLGLITQGKIKIENKSPFTLDDTNSVAEMLAALKKKKKKNRSVI